jgi:PHD/YefM family antitoxin component YafN of YafNO toxin-antitoxin module
MTLPVVLDELGRVDEPRAVQEFADVFTQVAADGRPVIVRRKGEDLAAVIPLEYLELIREALAHQEMQKLTAQIDWDLARKNLRPSQEWFEGDEPKPF